MVQLMNSGPHSDGFVVAVDMNVGGGDTATIATPLQGLGITTCAIA